MQLPTVSYWADHKGTTVPHIWQPSPVGGRHLAKLLGVKEGNPCWGEGGWGEDGWGAGEGGKDHVGEVGWMGIGHGWETPR